jgi:hypothetical protein
MAIPVPLVRWPSEFEERGPKADPAILLVGEAKVGDVTFKVTALRIQWQGLGPDYRHDVAEHDYDVSLESLIEDVENLVESGRPAPVAMNGGHYLVWMVPSSIRTFVL